MILKYIIFNIFVIILIYSSCDAHTLTSDSLEHFTTESSPETTQEETGSSVTSYYSLSTTESSTETTQDETDSSLTTDDFLFTTQGNESTFTNPKRDGIWSTPIFEVKEDDNIDRSTTEYFFTSTSDSPELNSSENPYIPVLNNSTTQEINPDETSTYITFPSQDEITSNTFEVKEDNNIEGSTTECPYSTESNNSFSSSSEETTSIITSRISTNNNEELNESSTKISTTIGVTSVKDENTKSSISDRTINLITLKPDKITSSITSQEMRWNSRTKQPTAKSTTMSLGTLNYEINKTSIASQTTTENTNSITSIKYNVLDNFPNENNTYSSTSKTSYASSRSNLPSFTRTSTPSPNNISNNSIKVRISDKESVSLDDKNSRDKKSSHLRPKTPLPVERKNIASKSPLPRKIRRPRCRMITYPLLGQKLPFDFWDSVRNRNRSAVSKMTKAIKMMGTVKTIMFYHCTHLSLSYPRADAICTDKKMWLLGAIPEIIYYIGSYQERFNEKIWMEKSTLPPRSSEESCPTLTLRQGRLGLDICDGNNDFICSSLSDHDYWHRH